MLNIEDEVFLCIIEDREQVARMPCGNVAYKITKVDFVPF